VAPGIDIQRDILNNMEFKPVIDKNLKIINPAIYKDGIFGLRKIINNNFLKN